MIRGCSAERPDFDLPRISDYAPTGDGQTIGKMSRLSALLLGKFYGKAFTQVFCNRHPLRLSPELLFIQGISVDFHDFDVHGGVLIFRRAAKADNGQLIVA